MPADRDIPAPGEVQETVTRRRIIAEQKAAPPPNFWEYVSKLRPEDWTTLGGTVLHAVYIYRDQPPPTLSLGKFTSAVFPETGTPWADQEETEMAFMHRYGGGRYRFILKRGNERVCIHNFEMPGAYKDLIQRVPEPPNRIHPGPPAGPTYAPAPLAPGYGTAYSGFGSANAYANSYDPTARVAETAINTLAGQDKQAIEIASSALASAANVIKNFNSGNGSGVDEMQRAFMSACIAQMTAPKPDPIEHFARMMGVMREISGGANGVAGGIVDKVLTMIVDRGLNPPPSASGPAVSMGAELVRILPSVAQYITEGMQNYARIMEAQRDAIAIQRGSQQPAQFIPAQHTPPPPRPATSVQAALPASTVANSTTSDARQNGNGTMMDIMTLIESKIVEILQEPQSAEWAAEETLSFLDRMDKSIVPQLASGGESGLMALFQSRATLKPALANLPRLQEYIRAFLRYARETPETAAKPN
jgi:hypothetical protein